MMIKAGDKVKIIKDVQFCNTIKKGNIVEIDRVVDDFYYAKGHYFNDGSSLYWLRNYEFLLVKELEEKEMGVKAGDKVRVIEDVKDCDTIKKSDIIEIDRVRGDIFYVKDHKLNDTESQFFLFESEFELVEENKKYVWYLDDEEGTYFLHKGLDVFKFSKNGINTICIKKGEENSMLLTEEEAKQSPFFDKFTKHDPFEKWYYIRMKGNELDYLNLNFNDGNYFMDDNEEYGPHKSKFTEEECNEIIGTSSILYKELVNEK